MNFYLYRAEDFAADDDFKKWVCNPDGDSNAFWSSFLKEHPEKYYDIEEGRRLVLGLQRLPVSPDVEKQAGNIWLRIEKSISGREPVVSIWRRVRFAAASILILIGGIWWWNIPGQVGEKEYYSMSDAIEWKEVANNTGQMMEVFLSDSSYVSLMPNSRVKYQRLFNDSLRTLFLSGEAFFRVQKDADRPFMVHANGLVTKVLGTSFYIQARKRDPNVTVSVKTGRVSVFSEKTKVKSDPEAEGIVLSANQKATFERDRKTLSKSLVERPEAVGEVASGAFAFDAAPAGEVFQTLADVYGVEVIYDEDLFDECRLTIDLSSEDLFQKLEVICKVLDATYKLIDAQVIIYGKGCS